MKWLTEPLIVDPSLAALLARDLRRVAEADGHIHDRELALIDAFAGAIPEGTPPEDARLASPQLQRTYVRSLILLALADGALSDVEHALIKELAAEHGIEDRDVDLVVVELKTRFFGSPLAARELRESLKSSAQALGLDEEGVATLWN